jgi:signal transduction histidine kinase
MLYEFVVVYREAIIKKSREKLRARTWPSASVNELENGVPLFLTQLSETLRAETIGVSHFPGAMHATATGHGRDLLALGFSVSQVVHDYGDICQAVTEVAIERHAPITTEEFHTLNRCLDTAIADAVTEHSRITEESRTAGEIERLGQLAHDIRNLLDTTLLAFGILKRGTVAIDGSTGMVMGRSLMGLHDLVESAMSDVRLAANHQRYERVAVTSFIEEIALAGSLHAEYLGVRFAIEPVNPQWAINVDPQLVSSAVTNLLNNAFKRTRTGGRVVLRTRNEGGRLVVEVEDECEGVSESGALEPGRPAAGTGSRDRGLGLAIARNAVRAHGGDIRVRNMPGRGSVFAIDVPLAAPSAPPGA